METVLTQKGSELQELINKIQPLDNIVTELSQRKPAEMLVCITYSELVALRDSRNLIPGQMYRMTDYETSCGWLGTQVAGHPFDLVLTALDNKALSERCSAIWSERDTDGYFAKCNLPAWDILYCLDNDFHRYNWAVKGGKYLIVDDGYGEVTGVLDGTAILDGQTYYKWAVTAHEGIAIYTMTDEPREGDEVIMAELGYEENAWAAIVTRTEYREGGKGVIYKLNDESENSVCYDFKNIMFACPLNSENVYDPENGVETYCYTFSLADPDGGTVKDYSVINPQKCYRNKLGDCSYFNVLIATEGYQTDNTFGNGCLYNILGNSCCDNTFGLYCEGNALFESCSGNVFGDYCTYNILAGYNVDNTFGCGCSDNTISESSSCNTFVCYCGGNFIGNNSSSNTLENNCVQNILGDNCHNNILGQYCNGITFGDDCTDNIIQNSCYDISFGDDCSCNQISAACSVLKFGNSCLYNIFTSICKNNALGDYFENNNCCCMTRCVFTYNTVGNTFNNVYDCSFGEMCGGNRICESGYITAGDQFLNNDIAACPDGGNTFGFGAQRNTLFDSSGGRFGENFRINTLKYTNNIEALSNCVGNVIEHGQYHQLKIDCEYNTIVDSYNIAVWHASKHNEFRNCERISFNAPNGNPVIVQNCVVRDVHNSTSLINITAQPNLTVTTYITTNKNGSVVQYTIDDILNQ